MYGKYAHLTKEERDVIAVLKAEGKTLSDIARQVGRHRSTIARELNRNASARKGYYFSHKAQEISDARWAITHKRVRLKNKEIRKYVDAHLRRCWSPEIIANRLPIEEPAGESISHEAIYQYIYEEKRELIFYLARMHRRRMRRGYSRKRHKSYIPDRVSILDRPDIINKRERIGDWENDTIVSRQSSVTINVLTDRKSRVTILKKLQQKTAGDVKSAVLESLGKYPTNCRHSITYDNGSENTKHGEINKILDIRSYFCEPYHSWEKGTVENTIGLIRRWIPKKKDLSGVSGGIIVGIEKWLNNRPRKCLNYQTPLEVWEKEKSVALAG